MLSKPKYMLPGNLSQGAPILEPDENGNYNFSFALDGDELVEKYRYKIYSLEPLELAKEDINLSLDDFYIKKENIETGKIDDVSLKDCIVLTHIEVMPDKERNIQFMAEFDFPRDQKIYIKKDKYPQENFLLPEYHGEIIFNYKIIVTDWGVLSYLNRTNKQGITNFPKSDWRTPLFNIFKDGQTNFFSELIFLNSVKLKIDDTDNEIGFINTEADKIKAIFSYSKSELDNTFQKLPGTKYYDEEGYYVPWAQDKTEYTIIDRYENIPGRKYVDKDEPKKSFKKVTTLDNDIIYYYTAFYADSDEYLPRTAEYPQRIEKVRKTQGYDWDSYVKKPAAFFFEIAPYTKDYYKISDNSSIEVNLTKSEQNLLFEKERDFNEMPKNQKGQYNFITFEISKYNNENEPMLPPGHYCWGVEILKKDSFNEDEIIATSNYYHFDVFENKKECSLFIDKSKVSIYINDITNNSPYLLDYSFEISNDKVLFYKSPWINSNNSTIIFPFKHFPFKINYSTTFTTTDLEQKMLSENNFFYSLKEYDKTIEFKEENEKISLKSEKEIKNLSIFRVNKNNDKIIFIKKISLEPNMQTSIDDIGNNFSEYYYYLINDDTGEWQYSLDKTDKETGEINPVYCLNKNLDKWRLILTKGEKNDIIEEKRMCHYQVDKIYDFYYNLVSGSIGNNAETTVNTNFTSMPSVQKGFSNYWSGSLSALMGICDERGEFAQTIEQEKALEQLVLDQEHDKFLLDREGNIWQVEISAPLTIANQDGLVQVDKLIDLKTITINWVQVGSPTQIVFDFEE